MSWSKLKFVTSAQIGIESSFTYDLFAVYDIRYLLARFALSKTVACKPSICFSQPTTIHAALLSILEADHRFPDCWKHQNLMNTSFYRSCSLGGELFLMYGEDASWSILYPTSRHRWDPTLQDCNIKRCFFFVSSEGCKYLGSCRQKIKIIISLFFSEKASNCQTITVPLRFSICK